MIKETKIRCSDDELKQHMRYLLKDNNKTRCVVFNVCLGWRENKVPNYFDLICYSLLPINRDGEWERGACGHLGSSSCWCYSACNLVKYEAWNTLFNGGSEALFKDLQDYYEIIFKKRGD